MMPFGMSFHIFRFFIYIYICSLSFPKRSAVFGLKHVLSIDVLNMP